MATWLIRSLVVCAAIGFVCAWPAQATVIDFESVTPGPLAPAGLAAYGISSITESFSFGSSLSHAQARDMNDPNMLIPSGHRVFWTSGYWYPGYGTATTTLNFVAPVTHFSFKKIAGAQGPYFLPGWKAEAFDATGNPVSMVDRSFAGGLDLAYAPFESLTLGGTNPIAKVVFSVNYNYMSAAGTGIFDDFEYTFAPEPTALVLLAAGLFPVLARRTRRI